MGRIGAARKSVLRRRAGAGERHRGVRPERSRLRDTECPLAGKAVLATGLKCAGPMDTVRERQQIGEAGRTLGAVPLIDQVRCARQGQDHSLRIGKRRDFRHLTKRLDGIQDPVSTFRKALEGKWNALSQIDGVSKRCQILHVEVELGGLPPVFSPHSLRMRLDWVMM